MGPYTDFNTPPDSPLAAPSPLQPSMSVRRGIFSPPPSDESKPHHDTILHVRSVQPSRGPPGTNINVLMDFHNSFSAALSVRLVLLRRPLATDVRQVGGDNGVWQVSATVPKAPGSVNLPLEVEALTLDGEVVARADCGHINVVNPPCTSLRSSCGYPRLTRSHSQSPPIQISVALGTSRRRGLMHPVRHPARTP